MPRVRARKGAVAAGAKRTSSANIHEGDLDEARMARRAKQAAALPGWVP